jgi:hypothetical protein
MRASGPPWGEIGFWGNYSAWKTVDWIQSYLELTEGLPTPPLFRLWVAISAVASVLERKVWLHSTRQITYPNMYILLVGKPTAGKDQAITPAQRLLVASKSVIMSPDDMTKAAMIDVLAESKRRIMFEGQTREYHPLCVIVPEFGTFISAHDLDFFSVLNKLFDNKDEHKSQRRGHNSGKPIIISHPTVNILAGTQPGFLNSLLPEEAWHMGLTSRLILIHGSEAPKVPLFSEEDDRTQLTSDLVKGLAERGKLMGPFRISEEAMLNLSTWVENGMKPAPEHPRLIHYAGRRRQYILKLSMVAAVSRKAELFISFEDTERAKSWLVSAEASMPDIFRDMVMKSDSILMNELHRYAYAEWVKTSPRDISQRLPIDKSKLMRFLAHRCTVHVAEKILEVMVIADWFELDRNNPLLYTPRTRGFRIDE